MLISGTVLRRILDGPADAYSFVDTADRRAGFSLLAPEHHDADAELPLAA